MQEPLKLRLYTVDIMSIAISVHLYSNLQYL